MKLTEIQRTEIPDPYNPSRRPRNSVYRKLISRFLESGTDAVRVTDEAKGPSTIYNSLIIQNKRMDSPVIVMRRKDDIYLLRKDGEVLSASR